MVTGRQLIEKKWRGLFAMLRSSRYRAVRAAARREWWRRSTTPDLRPSSKMAALSAVSPGASVNIKHLAFNDFFKLGFRRAFMTGPSPQVNHDGVLSVVSPS